MCQANLGLTIPYTMLFKWVWEWYFVLYRQNVLARGPKRLLFFDIVQKMELWIKIIYFANLVFEFWRKRVKWVKNKWAKFPHTKNNFLVLYGIISSPGDVVHVRWKRVWRILRWSWDGLPSLSYLPSGKYSPLIYVEQKLAFWGGMIEEMGEAMKQVSVSCLEFASFMFWKVSSGSHHDNQ